MKNTTLGEMFHFNGLDIELHLEVYDPAEDSFLLLETLHIDPGDAVLEIGTGCGFIALECARQGAHVICTDINPFAVTLAKHNIKRNQHLLKGDIEVRKGDLFSVIKEGEVFDVIVFNPPYLPTSNEEKVGDWFDKAIDGGKDGLAVTKRFIAGVRACLSQNGRAYFVFSTLSNRSKLENYFKQKKIKYEVVSHSRFDSEVIEIYCLHR